MTLMWQGILTMMIFTALLMGILLIPLLHAVEAYKKSPKGKQRKYSVLFELDEPLERKDRR
jgi:hypothetical protein